VGQERQLLGAVPKQVRQLLLHGVQILVVSSKNCVFAQDLTFSHFFVS